MKIETTQRYIKNQDCKPEAVVKKCLHREANADKRIVQLLDVIQNSFYPEMKKAEKERMQKISETALKKTAGNKKLKKETRETVAALNSKIQELYSSKQKKNTPPETKPKASIETSVREAAIKQKLDDTKKYEELRKLYAESKIDWLSQQSKETMRLQKQLVKIFPVITQLIDTTQVEASYDIDQIANVYNYIDSQLNRKETLLEDLYTDHPTKIAQVQKRQEDHTQQLAQLEKLKHITIESELRDVLNCLIKACDKEIAQLTRERKILLERNELKEKLGKEITQPSASSSSDNI